MARSKLDKQRLLAALGDHVLEHGLNTASLRPMAEAAGTSDRMLIYHFGSKDNLIAQLLEYLANQMAAGLNNALPPEPFVSESRLIERIMTLLRSDQLMPYMRLWFDIVSAAAHGQTAHLQAARGIVDTYLAWIAKRHPAGEEGAPRTLTIIEGLLVMDAVGSRRIADQAIARLSAGTGDGEARRWDGG